MKYDDASWHYGGNFPEGLPDEAGATHTGMYVAWALLAGMAGPFFDDFPDDLAILQARTQTPGEFFLDKADGKFVDDMLTEEGNAFTQAYFDFEKGSYLGDYGRLVGDSMPTLYHVPDTWQVFDILRPVLDDRLRVWRNAR
jgi:hypothetical protein